MKILISSVLVILFLFTAHTGAEEVMAPTAPKIDTQVAPSIKTEPVDYIKHYANLYGANESDLRKVIHCESRGKQTAIGDGGRAIGIAQFHKGTFNAYAKQLGENLDIQSEHDQIKLMAYMFSIGQGNHWTAYRALKNGGTYSFYSKLLQKHFTVSCK